MLTNEIDNNFFVFGFPINIQPNLIKIHPLAGLANTMFVIATRLVAQT